jgi:uncharacterized protein YbjT (DUF2867 family)
MERRRVLLLGATGLIGGELLPLLLADDGVARVVVIARRATGVQHAKLEEHLFDLADMEQHAGAFENIDAVFCALGTTMRVAGSEERFRFVDHDLPLVAARLALAGGATHYLLVSSLGAHATSRVFYNRVKGEVERDLAALPYRALTIVRPSFLLGPRNEFRLGEQVVAALRFLFPPKIKPIEAHTVARALVALSKRDDAGVRIVESRELRALSGAVPTNA